MQAGDVHTVVHVEGYRACRLVDGSGSKGVLIRSPLAFYGHRLDGGFYDGVGNVVFDSAGCEDAGRQCQHAEYAGQVLLNHSFHVVRGRKSFRG